MADELQSWFKKLPYKLQRELAGRLKDIADDLAEDIKREAPVKTGALRDSIRVRRGRKSLEFVISAGGPSTTHTYERSTGYRRDVVIDGRDNRGIARGNQGVTYDYALAQEFGTQKSPARPFFYSTYRAQAPEIRETIEQAVSEVVEKA
jgi:HK97 gp10 family phage protein